MLNFFKVILFIVGFIFATQVTFLVDMSDQAVVSGDGDYPAVYVSGGNINGPSGIEMTDIGDGIWTLTTVSIPYQIPVSEENETKDDTDSDGIIDSEDKCPD